jgi:hypothetical protein
MLDKVVKFALGVFARWRRAYRARRAFRELDECIGRQDIEESVRQLLVEGREDWLKLDDIARRRAPHLEHVEHIRRWLISLGVQPTVPPKILRPPGSCLRAIADFVYSRKTVEHVFKPMIADLEYEYIEALAAGRPLKARWVHIRGIFAFWMTAAVHASTSTVVQAISIGRFLIGG